MIRVLQSVSNMDRAGIETMLMNYYRHMDRSRIQFDFLVNKPKPGDYDEEIRSLGGRIFLGPGLSPAKYPRYMRFMGNLLRENPDIVILHAHNEAMQLYALNGAKRYGLGVRIAHAHNTMIHKDYKWPLKVFCKRFIPHAATDYWSCGRDAGIYYFGRRRWERNGFLLHNAIDLSAFGFHPEIRERLRREHDLENCLVVGNVGRFNVQKNHARLIDIFASLSKIREDARLVLIGTGELEGAMKRKAAELGLSSRVLFMGLRDDVQDWYQAMDVFVMPSLHEGLPVVGIEAQAAGLPSLFSDAVTDEVVLLPGSGRVSLNADASIWAERIIKAVESTGLRGEGRRIVGEAGYDIEQEAAKLQKLYLEMAERTH